MSEGWRSAGGLAFALVVLAWAAGVSAQEGTLQTQLLVGVPYPAPFAGLLGGEFDWSLLHHDPRTLIKRARLSGQIEALPRESQRGGGGVVTDARADDRQIVGYLHLAQLSPIDAAAEHYRRQREELQNKPHAVVAAAVGLVSMFVGWWGIRRGTTWPRISLGLAAFLIGVAFWAYGLDSIIQWPLPVVSVPCDRPSSVAMIRPLSRILFRWL